MRKVITEEVPDGIIPKDPDDKDEVMKRCRYYSKIFRSCVCVFARAGHSLRGDKHFVLWALSMGDGHGILKYTLGGLQDDKDVVLKAVKQNGLSLEFAGRFLREDKDIVLEAVKQNGLSLKYAHVENRDIAMAAVKQNGLSLKYAHVENRDIAMAAVKQNGLSLQFSELRDDEEIIMAAVKQNGLALECIYECAFPFEDIMSSDIVLEAVKQNGLSLQWTSYRHHLDKDIVLEAVKQNVESIHWWTNWTWEYADRRWSETQDFCEISESEDYVIEHDPFDPWDDEDIVLEIVKQDGLYLEDASKRLQNNDKIVIAAMQNNTSSLQYASRHIQTIHKKNREKQDAANLTVVSTKRLLLNNDPPDNLERWGNHDAKRMRVSKEEVPMVSETEFTSVHKTRNNTDQSRFRKHHLNVAIKGGFADKDWITGESFPAELLQCAHLAHTYKEDVPTPGVLTMGDVHVCYDKLWFSFEPLWDMSHKNVTIVIRYDDSLTCDKKNALECLGVRDGAVLPSFVTESEFCKEKILPFVLSTLAQYDKS